jgi:DNA-binding transcriptional regulator YhcF (GntR family)
MPRPTKHHAISQLIKQRIDSGVYYGQAIPGAKAIAAELGVSYMTARKALEQLVERNVLTRLENSRLTATETAGQSKDRSRYLLLAPAFESFGLTALQMSIERVICPMGGVLNVKGYRNWHDTALMSAFDEDWAGIFMIPPSKARPNC